MNTTSTHAASRFLSPRWLGPAVAALGGALLLGGDALRPAPPRLAPPRPVPVSLSTPTAPAAPVVTFAPRTKAIEEVRVGDRVVAGNPEGAADEPAVDPATWVQIGLTLTRPDDVVEIVLLRPRAWADAVGARPGSVVPLELHELGAAGPAVVESVGPCPPLAPGAGRVVTGTFRHRSARVLDLSLDGESATIGVTAGHPFWSEDRGRFVPASELREGERLRTLKGSTHLATLVPRSEAHAVYNLEVNAEHTYRVTHDGILVHNGCVSTPWGARDPQTGKWTTGARGGADPVDDFIAKANANGFQVLGREVYVRTPFGVRRLDVVVKNLATGKIGGVEIKSTIAEFMKNQTSQYAKDAFINRFGAKAFGKAASEGMIGRIDWVVKLLW